MKGLRLFRIYATLVVGKTCTYPIRPKGETVPIDNQNTPRHARPAASRPQGTRFRSTQSASSSSSSRPSSYSRTGGSHSSSRVQPAYARRSAAPKKTSPVPVIIAVVVAIAIVAASLLFALPAITNLFMGGSDEPQVEAGIEVQVNIPEGASGDQIASILSEAGVIPDPKTYYAEVKAQNADTSLKPGDYLFTTLEDPADVVAQLVAGPNVEGTSVTIAEGLSTSQTAARVEEAYGISSDDFLAQAKASNYVADYPFLEGVADDSLEGYLYPKTYSFTSTPTADQVIRAMLDQFELEVASLDFDSARATIQERYGVEMSDYDFINLASIVEREGLTAEQRGKVASTFYNRFEAGMPLQSDATMMYVTGGAVTADDLDQESPYNSYKNQGLPPTPICSPSLESIEATLNPPETDYLYFFITTEDEWFSETYDGHLAAIEENR